MPGKRSREQNTITEQKKQKKAHIKQINQPELLKSNNKGIDLERNELKDDIIERIIIFKNLVIKETYSPIFKQKIEEILKSYDNLPEEIDRLKEIQEVLIELEKNSYIDHDKYMEYKQKLGQQMVFTLTQENFILKNKILEKISNLRKQLDFLKSKNNVEPSNIVDKLNTELNTYNNLLKEMSPSKLLDKKPLKRLNDKYGLQKIDELLDKLNNKISIVYDSIPILKEKIDPNEIIVITDNIRIKKYPNNTNNILKKYNTTTNQTTQWSIMNKFYIKAARYQSKQLLEAYRKLNPNIDNTIKNTLNEIEERHKNVNDNISSKELELIHKDINYLIVLIQNYTNTGPRIENPAQTSIGSRLHSYYTENPLLPAPPKVSSFPIPITFMEIFIGIIAIIGISLSIYFSMKPNNGFCDLNNPNNIIIILIVIIAILIYKKY